MSEEDQIPYSFQSKITGKWMYIHKGRIGTNKVMRYYVSYQREGAELEVPRGYYITDGHNGMPVIKKKIYVSIEDKLREGEFDCPLE